MQHVGILQTTTPGVDIDDGHDEEGDACWQRQANVARKTWARRGKLHTDTTPWTRPARGPRPSARGLPTPVSRIRAGNHGRMGSSACAGILGHVHTASIA